MAHTPRFHEWIAAERAAQEAEGRWHRAQLAFARDEGPPPPSLLEAEALRKRQHAHALFQPAMDEMRTLAQSLHHRELLGTPPTEEGTRRRA